MERPVRVAHIITRLILGGAQENTLYTVIGQQRTPGFAVTLIVGAKDTAEGDLTPQAREAGVNLIEVPSLIRPIQPLTDLRALVDLYRLLRKGKYDIVHTHSSKAGIIGRVAAYLAGVPIIVHTLHSLVFHEYETGWKNWLYIRLKRLCAPLTDILISVNDKTAQGALARGIGRPQQHVTIFSGMELDRFLEVGAVLAPTEAKRRLGIPAEAPVVGKIARLFPLKGHEQFLDAARHIARLKPDTWFVLVGDGPLRGELEARARKEGIFDRTIFTGRVPPDHVPHYIQAMDVVVHTSLREGIARVLPQAGAVGKPVVTFDLDGASEAVRDGVSGWLVPPLDTSALATRVVELFADPDRRRTFGEAGRVLAIANFRVEEMVNRINQLYYDQIERKGLVWVQRPREGASVGAKTL
jgi:glycosyltransferase involved in cell wall biosynthesis